MIFHCFSIPLFYFWCFQALLPVITCHLYISSVNYLYLFLAHFLIRMPFFLFFFFFSFKRQTVMCRCHNKVSGRHMSHKHVNTQSSCSWSRKGPCLFFLFISSNALFILHDLVSLNTNFFPFHEVEGFIFSYISFPFFLSTWKKHNSEPLLIFTCLFTLYHIGQIIRIVEKNRIFDTASQ